MNISEQLKAYRKKLNLSQDELAEIVFVSRQTISNWETGKSYPDLKSLLLMGDYFEISLDKLVKGDLQVMKEQVGVTTLHNYSFGMMIGFGVMIFGTVFFIKTQKTIGLTIGILGAIIMIYSAFQAERIKKKLDIQTYSEIVAYMEGRKVLRSNRRSPIWSVILKIILSTAVTLIIIYLALLLF
ncbi:helix-turn-helix transcriptional regulator [Pseudolactococcus yaeyamensis]